jgi:hypothetical protein
MARVVILGVAVLALTATLAWNAAEQHYRGCVEAAVARTEGVRIPSPAAQFDGEEPSGALRIRALKGCSRWP